MHLQQPFPACSRILWWYTENCVNLTSTSAPNLKHSKKKVQKIHQTHDDPRGPRKKKCSILLLLLLPRYKIDVLRLHWWFLVCPLPAMEWAPKKGRFPTRGSEQKTACWTTQHKFEVVKVDIQFDSLCLGFKCVGKISNSSGYS